jgi:hypothetical protein
MEKDSLVQQFKNKKISLTEKSIQDELDSALKRKDQASASKLFDELSNYRKNTELQRSGKQSGTRSDTGYTKSSSESGRYVYDKKNELSRMDRSLAKLKIQDD